MRSAGGAHKHGLNRALADASLAEVRRMLRYKCTWYGSALVEADRYFPSSKLCSACGRRKPSLTLADRTYMCDHCGLRIDRDLNAAINLARLGDTPRTGETRTGTGVAGRQPPGWRRTWSHAGDRDHGSGQRAGCEASTRHNNVGKTGTAPPEGEAA